MDKLAKTAFPIHDLVAARWSPRAFAPRAVSRDEVGSLLEAARWAASSFNEQPWSFFVATHDEPERYDALASCLMSGNAWAKAAPVLLLAVARTAFSRNGKPNRHAGHDVGLALANVMLQAQALGLATHAMAGFDPERARALLEIPVSEDPLTMLAIGYPGEASSLAEGLREAEAAPRARRALTDFVFGAGWGRPYEPLNSG